MPGKLSPSGAHPVLRRPAASMRRHSFWNAIFAVVIASLLWGYINARNIETRVLEIPLEIKINPSVGWEYYQKPTLATVKVTLSGPSKIIQSLRPEDLLLQHTENVPNSAGSIHSVNLSLTSLQVHPLPEEVTVISIEPDTVKFQLAKLVEKDIPVAPQTTGKLGAGFQIGALRLDRQTVQVRMPEALYNEGMVIKTIPINLTKKQQTFTQWVGFQPLQISPTRVITPLQDRVVEVTVEVTHVFKKQTFEKVPVQVLLATPDAMRYAWRLDPPHVKVTVQGRADMIADLKQAEMTIYVDTRGMGSSREKIYPLKCQSIAPTWVKVLKIEPAQVKWVRR